MEKGLKIFQKGVGVFLGNPMPRLRHAKRGHVRRHFAHHVSHQRPRCTGLSTDSEHRQYQLSPFGEGGAGVRYVPIESAVEFKACTQHTRRRIG